MAGHDYFMIIVSYKYIVKIYVAYNEFRKHFLRQGRPLNLQSINIVPSYLDKI